VSEKMALRMHAVGLMRKVVNLPNKLLPSMLTLADPDFDELSGKTADTTGTL
jgi:hypothetical protein